MIKEDTVYEGEVFFGKKEGWGMLSWTDNSLLEGHWHNGKINGLVRKMTDHFLFREDTSGMMAENTLVSGQTKSFTELESTGGKMERSTKESTKMTRRMVLVFTPCKMEELMKAGGMMASSMESEHSYFLIVSLHLIETLLLK